MITLEALLRTLNKDTEISLCVRLHAGGTNLSMDAEIYCGRVEDIDLEDDMKTDIVRKVDAVDTNCIEIVVD